MTKTITTEELGASVDEVFQSVDANGDCYVVERNGRTIGAVVPKSVFDAMQRERRGFFRLMDRMAAGGAGDSDLEIQADIDKAIAAVRAERRGGGLTR